MATRNSTLTIENLRELVAYDPVTGIFRQRIRTSQRVKVGDVIGSKSTNGYVALRLDGVHCSAHRAAWAYVYGTWPDDQLDHINGLRSDNRIANLREATRAENGQNRAKNKSSVSGFVGVSWNCGSRKWAARISKDGKLTSLGHYDDPIEASRAYLAAKAVIHTFNPIPRDLVNA